MKEYLKSKAKKCLIIAIIAISIFILIAGFILGIKKELFKALGILVSNGRIDNSVSVIGNQQVDENGNPMFDENGNPIYDNYSFNIDEQIKQDIDEKLRNMAVDPKTLGLDKDSELLDKMLKAEVVTNYPEIGEQKEDGFQGVIHIKKGNSDGKVEKMSYLPEEKFNAIYDNLLNNNTTNFNGSITVPKYEKKSNHTIGYVSGTSSSNKDELGGITLTKTYTFTQTDNTGVFSDEDYPDLYSVAAGMTGIQGAPGATGIPTDDELNTDDALQSTYKYFTLDDNMNLVIISYNKNVTITGYNTLGINYYQSNIDGKIYNESTGDEFSASGFNDTRLFKAMNTKNYNTTKEYVRTVTYTIEKNVIAYKNLVSQYSIPFEFLVALLLVGDNQQWMETFVDDIIQDSQIDIVIHENKSYISDRTVISYEQNKAISDEDYSISKYSGQIYDCKENIIENHTRTVDITYVKTWIYNKIQAYNSFDINSQAEDYTNFDEETFGNEVKLTVNGKERSFNKEGSSFSYFKKDNDGNQTGITLHNPLKQVRNTEQRNEWRKVTEKNGDEEGEGTEEINIHPFLRLWKNAKGKAELVDEDRDGTLDNEKFVSNGKLVNYGEPSPSGNIESATDFLWELLGENERTQNYEIVMKYLLYKYNGTNYGVDDEDMESMLALFQPSSMMNSTTIGLAAYLNQFGGSSSEGIEKDGYAYYQMYNDSAGNPTIGSGDIQYKSHYQKFEVQGYVYKDGQRVEVSNVNDYVESIMGSPTASWQDSFSQIYVDKELVDTIRDQIAQQYVDKVLSDTSGISLSQQQLYALAAICYQRGHLPGSCGRIRL